MRIKGNGRRIVDQLHEDYIGPAQDGGSI